MDFAAGGCCECDGGWYEFGMGWEGVLMSVHMYVPYMY